MHVIHLIETRFALALGMCVTLPSVMMMCLPFEIVVSLTVPLPDFGIGMLPMPQRVMPGMAQ